jgi:hypothetical protein
MSGDTRTSGGSDSHKMLLEWDAAPAVSRYEKSTSNSKDGSMRGSITTPRSSNPMLDFLSSQAGAEENINEKQFGRVKNPIPAQNYHNEAEQGSNLRSLKMEDVDGLLSGLAVR